MDEPKKKRYRRKVSDHAKPYSLHGSFKYDTNSMPVSRRKSKSNERVLSKAPKDKAKKTMASGNSQSQSYSCIHGEIPVNKIPSDDQIFINMIKSTESYLPIDIEFKVFVLLDWDPISKALKQFSPVIVNRSGSQYTCTCNPDRTQYINNVASSSAEDLDKFHPPCIHITAIREIVSDYALLTGIQSILQEEDIKDHGYSMSKPYMDEDQVDVIPFLENMYVVRDEDNYSVVKTAFGTLKCLFCQKSEKCKHVEYLNKLLNSNEKSEDLCLNQIFDELNNYNHVKQYRLKCYSNNRIPFSLEGNLVSKISKKLCDLYQEVDGILQVYPENADICTSCGCHAGRQFEPMEKTSFLLTRYECRKAQVFSQKCCSCNAISYYDGGSDCILNMDRFLVHYEVLRDFMFQFLYSRSTMFAFYNVWCQHQTDGGNLNLKQIFPYMYFTQSWFCFLNKLDLAYEKDFLCEHCGNSPKILLFDGTALSFKKDFLPHIAETEIDETKFSGRHKDRVFINHKASRDLLSKYCKTGSSLSLEEFPLLKSSMAIHQPSLVPLLDNFENIGCTGSPPEEYKEFLSLLSKNSPVCGTFPYPKVDLLQQCIMKNATEDAELLLNLQNFIPVLFRLFSKIHELPGFFTLLFEEIIKKVNAPFQNLETHKTSTSKSENPLAYYPNLPSLQSRGTYTADKEKSKPGCSKKGTRHPVLLPGIFTVFCQHGINYGFEVMECAESPNRPFTFLKTRFENAPDIVIYDNACNLHQYCLNRDPVCFANTLMVVDGLHWDNHTGCTVGYKALDYPLLKMLNTQMVEQNNSKLRKLKSSLSYMTAEHFMDTLKFFLWHCNYTVKNKPKKQ